MKKLLLIEDEEILSSLVKEYLTGNSFEVTVAADGRKGLELFRTLHPDIVVSDVSLPYMDGYTIAREIRKENTGVPIIFLTSKSDTEDVIYGFESGGNDYIKKPFSMEELRVRINARLQDHSPASNFEEFYFGIFKFNFTTQSLSYWNENIALSYKEALLMKLLCNNINKVLPRVSTLIDIWGSDTVQNSRTLDVYMSKLRRILTVDEHVELINIRGFGYKLLVKSQK